MSKSATEYLFWANPKSIANSFEQRFYDENASLFNVKTSLYNENRSILDIIKSTIILQGLENRRQLNTDYLQFPKEQLQRKEIQEALVEQLPYIEDGGERIYIPTYSREINDIYYRHPEMLKERPYSDYLTNENVGVVNPFETYGFLLLDSPFTRLVKLDATKDDIHVYYHIDFETLFFIRKDLTLELELPILDEKAKRTDNLHLFDDLEVIAKDYFDGDIEKMFVHLKEKKLLSSSLFEECMEENTKYLRRKHKHAL
jgi:hypothetical protein